MARFLLYAIPFVVVLYAFIAACFTPSADVRSLPKWLWIVVIVVLPLFGAVGWLVAGRARRSAVVGSGPVPGRRKVEVAPDDDPAFLRRIGDDVWTQKMRDRRVGPAEGPAGDGATGPGDAAQTDPAPDHTGDHTGDHSPDPSGDGPRPSTT